MDFHIGRHKVAWQLVLSGVPHLSSMCFFVLLKASLHSELRQCFSSAKASKGIDCKAKQYHLCCKLLNKASHKARQYSRGIWINVHSCWKYRHLHCKRAHRMEEAIVGAVFKCDLPQATEQTVFRRLFMKC